VPPRGPLLDLPLELRADPHSRSAAAPPRAEPAEPLSVAELDRRLKRAVESSGRVEVAGEVRGLREVSSGHVYFSLKDEREDAVIDCVLYRAASPRARTVVKEGARVVLAGRATLWAPRGRLQFTVEDARPIGRGALLEALERLKAKLHAEGLFSPTRKRRLPPAPRVVGVVTSSDGAAIHDLITVAFRRGAVRLVLARAPVQGPSAAARIQRALEMLARHPEVEVIVLTRGGGSADDLAAYDDEDLARAIAACAVPVVSAVGHETDVSIADLVADARAATPSQAAEMLVPDTRARREALRHLEARMRRAVLLSVTERRRAVDRGRAALEATTIGRVTAGRAALASLERRLNARHPRAELQAARADLSPLVARLDGAIATRLAEARGTIATSAARLDALSPLRVLARGYAIATDERGVALQDASSVAPGDRIDVRLHRGTVRARVDEVNLEGDEP
jgi:exodeoxyribonuclease VII large subunit